jgi:hypothetical protein
MNIAKETGETARSLFVVLKDQPLVLMMGLMNLLLVVFMFYYTSSILTQRASTTDQIVKWQTATDTLMANCVSKDVLESVVGALERQLQEMRKQLNGGQSVPVPRSRPPEADLP